MPLKIINSGRISIAAGKNCVVSIINMKIFLPLNLNRLSEYPTNIEKNVISETLITATNKLFLKYISKPTTSHAVIKFIKVAGLGKYEMGKVIMSRSYISDVLIVQYSGKIINRSNKAIGR